MLYYPAIPLWSVVLTAALAYAVSVYAFKREDQEPGSRKWPVMGGITRFVALAFAIIAVWRVIEGLTR